VIAMPAWDNGPPTVPVGHHFTVRIMIPRSIALPVGVWAGDHESEGCGRVGAALPHGGGEYVGRSPSQKEMQMADGSCGLAP
jgi:hypothetical protein